MTDGILSNKKPMTHEERLQLIMKPFQFNIIPGKIAGNQGYGCSAYTADMNYEIRINKLKT